MATITGCLISLLVFITVFELYSAQQRLQCPRDFRMKRNYECRQASYRSDNGRGRRGGRMAEYRYFIEDCCIHDHGNQNNRPNRNSVPRQCRQRRDEGYRCRSQRGFEHYYYDQNSGRCRRFYHQGCGGNSNNFHSYSECQRTCRRRFA